MMEPSFEKLLVVLAKFSFLQKVTKSTKVLRVRLGFAFYDSLAGDLRMRCWNILRSLRYLL
jgi:hypothetical protein